MKIVDENRPRTNSLVQTNAENKFVGALAWKALDLVTFGVLEKPHQKQNKTKNATKNSTA